MVTILEFSRRRWLGAAVLILVILSLSACLKPNSPSDPADPCDAMPAGLIGSAPSFYGNPVRVDVQGDYAYVVDWQGSLQIFDVSDPCNPVSMGSAQGSDNEFQDVKVMGDYAYVANDADGLAKYDVSDPASPSRVSARSDGMYAVSVDTNERYLFVSYLYTEAPSLAVYDQSTFPSDMTASYDAGPSWPHHWETAVQGDRAYLISYDGPPPIFQVLDISDLPTGPVLLGSLDLPDTLYGAGFGMKVAGDYAYLASMDVDTADGGLVVVNIADGANPYVEGMVTNPNAALPFWKRPGLDVSGDRVYVAGKDGLYGYDVADPANPTQTTFFPYPESFGLMGSGDVAIQGDLAFVTAFYPDGDPAASPGGLAIYRLSPGNNPP